MKRSILQAPFALALLALAAACSKTEAAENTDVGPVQPGADAPAKGPAMPNERCRPADPLAADVNGYFREATDEVGLGNLNVARITAADLDGDGLPDLIFHGHPSAREVLPDGVNRRIFMNRGGKFVETTKESGFSDSRDGKDTGRLAHISVLGDVDNDGDLDVFEGTYIDSANAGIGGPKDRSEIWLNDGKGHFTMADQSGPSQKALPTSGASFADYDRDGVLDLFVGTFYASSEGAGNYLYQGDGTGQFADVSQASGVLRPATGGKTEAYLAGKNRKPAYGITVCDIDSDGDPDLLVSGYGRSFNELWLNDGGVFTEVGMGTPFAADDNVQCGESNEFYRCYCAAPENAGKCPAGVPKPVVSCDRSAWTPGFDDQPARGGGNTFTTACGDLDNDGDMDVILAEIRHWHIGPSSDTSQILLNELKDGVPNFTRLPNGPKTLERQHTIKDWNEGDMDVGMFDFDNDGKKDIWLSSSDYPDTWGELFQQQADGSFRPVAEQAGVRHYHAHAFATVDIDGDGDLDLIVATSGARCGGDSKCPPVPLLKVYKNEHGHKRNALRIRLDGKGAGAANRSAIGARVAVTVGGVTQVQEVSGGYGHFGLQHDTVLNFGLGDSCRADKVEIRWPDAQGTVQTLANVPSNYLMTVHQGQDAPEFKELTNGR
jgi:hypothetical protein